MGLKCTVPGCKGVINAFAGLQELGKLRQHMEKKHYTRWGMTQALEQRVLMERGLPVKTPAVLISMKGDKLYVKRLREDHHKIHGFGTFFWNVKPDEVMITDEAWDVLARCVNKRYSSCGDLFGIDIGWVGMEAKVKTKNDPDGIEPEWRGMLVNYASIGKSITVPEEDVTVDPKAWELLRQTQGRGL